MLAVFRREIRAYFISPIGYLFMGVFLILSGAALAATTLYAATASLTNYFFYLMMSFVVLIPILTMRLFSEERKLKTDQLLLTSPVSLFGIVFAKFAAAFSLFAATLLLSCLNFLTVIPYGAINGAVCFSNVFGILCIGGAFCAIGLFISALTENQLISALLSIGVIFAFLGIGLITPGVTNTTLRVFLKWLSVFDRYYTFGYGLFDFTSVLYFISITLIFLFLTVRVLEKRRWE